MAVLIAESAQDEISSIELSKGMPSRATVPNHLKAYTTFQAHIKDGRIILPEGVYLPEGTSLLITFRQDDSPLAQLGDSSQYTDEELGNMTLGEQIIVALKDVIAGQTTRVETEEQIEAFLDSLEEE